MTSIEKAAEMLNEQKAQRKSNAKADTHPEQA